MFFLPQCLASLASGHVLALTAETKYHRLTGFNNTHLFLAVLEAGKSKVKVLAD